MILKKSLLLLFGMAWLLMPMQVFSQELYDISYQSKTLEQVISDLRKKIGYEFVYQKQILSEAPSITCTYHQVTLEQILDRIFYNDAELDYEIVEKTIILSKPKTEQAYFKRLITGVIVDEEGEALPGANIMLLGTNTGAVSDIDGQFSLIIEGRDPMLRTTYIGMKTQDIRLSRQKENFIVIQMQHSTQLIDEVVVTGYQNLKRETATGSYNTLSSKDMENRYMGSVVGNLEGKIPGLVSYSNGQNGDGESSLVIRGAGSFHANTNPLIVVDGLPIEGSIETVNPYEIDNITVLKDASAASIYGARASNGVIVITTKRAQGEKLIVNFNSDLTISERQSYNNFRWASAAEMIELERYNFDYIRGAEDQTAFDGLLNYYNNRRQALSPISRLLAANYLGEISDADLNVKLNRLGRNNYHQEWKDEMERTQVLQQYNLSLRTQGKALASTIVLNYKGDNFGMVNIHNNTLTFSYRGDLKATSWLDLAFGANIINERAKTRVSEPWGYGNIYSFQPYESLYNEDGSRSHLEADIYPGEESLSNTIYGFKPVTYNLLDEVGRNFEKTRRTNIRSFLHANTTIMPEWRVSVQFQYEDIYYKSNSYREADSYAMRYLYNLYTTESVTTEYDEDYDEYITTRVVKHHIPDGGRLDTQTSEGAYYTFRAQTDYNKIFSEKHEVEAAAGFEFRESQIKTYGSILMGYDEQTQTNSNGLMNYGLLKEMDGQASALGANYTLRGAPSGDDFTTSDVLHRFYSLYAIGGYTYDRRYTASFSYRVDKTDLFGTDPEFRGRPLWSVGVSWNLHNESFVKACKWIDALKLRASYGLTGNIDQTVSSYLTATIGVNSITGDKMATLNTPPNDHLRWEKTASLNFGLDFSLWRNRLSGSIDWYNKKGTDLLTTTDLDPTTGWSQLTINNGEALNRGVELQLNGIILRPVNRNSLGIRALLNFTYNKNEVTKVNHQPTSGSEALLYYTLHEGYPIHSLFAYRFAGMVNEDNIQYFSWVGADGQIHTSDINSEEFTVDDIVYCGELDPKYMAGFTPEISYAGFTLSAMISYYGGHYMRARVEDWSSDGNQYGYYQPGEVDAFPSAYLNYWRNEDKTLYPANGYLGGQNIVGDYRYMDTSVVPADYIKLRNIVLGYEFPRKLCQQIGVNTLRMRIQANNLATWTRNNLGVDPEANNPTTGINLLSTPRSYTMSLSINF